MIRYLETDIFFDIDEPEKIYWYDVDSHVKQIKIDRFFMPDELRYMNHTKNMGKFMVPMCEEEVVRRNVRLKIKHYMEKIDVNRASSGTAVNK